MDRTWIKSRMGARLGSWIARGLLLAAVVLGGVFLLQAQFFGRKGPRPSQHGSVSQQINDTRVTVEYNRPVARGRALFGALVPWGQVWTPGADEATTLTLSTGLQVNGKALAAGTYSLWTEPQQNRWTIIFNRVHPAFHTQYPAGQDVLRVPATPRAGSHMEALAFYFPVVEGKHAELVIHWGTVVVPLALDVP